MFKSKHETVTILGHEKCEKQIEICFGRPNVHNVYVQKSIHLLHFSQLRAFSRQLDEKTTQRAEASEVLRTLSANRLRLPSSLGYSPSCCSSKSANRRRSSWRETLTEVEDSCASTNSRIHYDSDTESLQVEPPDEKVKFIKKLASVRRIMKNQKSE